MYEISTLFLDEISRHPCVGSRHHHHHHRHHHHRHHHRHQHACFPTNHATMSSTRIVRRSWRKEGNKPVEMRAFMHDLRAASCELRAASWELGAGSWPERQDPIRPHPSNQFTNSPIPHPHTYPYLPSPRPPRALARRYYTPRYLPHTYPYLPIPAHTCPYLPSSLQSKKI